MRRGTEEGKAGVGEGGGGESNAWKLSARKFLLSSNIYPMKKSNYFP